MAKVLQRYGFSTKVGVTLNGKCITHEIDIVAKKNNTTYYIECKFHNRPGLKTDIQTALYTNARFQDITDGVSEINNHHSWLITNTKITKDVDSYAKCQNMKLTSWCCPGKESLFHLVVNSGLHPITAINSLSFDQMSLLLKQGVVTLKDLLNLIKNNHLKNLLSKQDIKKIKAEITGIYS